MTKQEDKGQDSKTADSSKSPAIGLDYLKLPRHPYGEFFPEMLGQAHIDTVETVHPALAKQLRNTIWRH